ncbi:hypothetical protein QBC36DRAFT_250441 [Triangularia setosa]|uniref:Uncharacterized protein n=1 Tax=Triangularia setosa TaxID=2587417 RepID=A0AAN7A0N3_9PEZI|nr:hypothetical protein QBC36DRAFT_250441 [Podospora setosa]
MTSRQTEPRQTPQGSLFRLESESETPRNESRITTPTPAKLGLSVIPKQGFDVFLDESDQNKQSQSHTLQHQYDELATPSSTIAEFGDKAARSIVPSATELVDHIHQSWSGSRDGSRTISKFRPRSTSNREPREQRGGRGERLEGSQDRSTTSILSAGGERSETSTQKHHHHSSSQGPGERNMSEEAMLTDEKVNRFLKSMQYYQSPSPPRSSHLGQIVALGKSSEIESLSNLTAENKSLYQRVAALQLTERELLAESQRLVRQIAALNHQLTMAMEELEASKQQNEAYNQHWRKVFTEKEDQYQKRIHEIGAQLIELSSTHPNPRKSKPLASNDEITIWFTDQDAAWRAWARAYGHHDPNRLLDGLHPAQLQEICTEVKGFVQLTNVEKLPVAILNGGREAVHTLLQAMLANFFCTEILGNPYWVFTAASLGTLESPSVSLPPKALGSPGTGFSMDMNLFGSGGNDVVGARESLGSFECGFNQVPRGRKFPPPLITSMGRPSGVGSASMLGLPLQNEIERLHFILLDAQDSSSSSQHAHWRAHMMRLFATGGMSLSPPHSPSASSVSSSRQALIDSRLNYARKHRERFLGGAARFLLHDQDALGIERLERVLTEMIDDALRFSCKLWSRTGGVRIRGWKDLFEFKGGYKKGMKVVKICQAQDRSYHGLGTTSGVSDSGNDEKNDDENEGRPVLMVVQPAIEAVIDIGDNEAQPPVWLKARVMVAAPVEDPVPGSGASDAGFAPSPVNVRSEAILPSEDSTREINVSPSSLETPRLGEVLSSASYAGHPIKTKRE